MTKFVATTIDDGRLFVHLPGAKSAANFYTLCGSSGYRGVDVPRGARVDCKACYEIWKLVQRYKRNDFVASDRLK